MPMSLTWESVRLPLATAAVGLLSGALLVKWHAESVASKQQSHRSRRHAKSPLAEDADANSAVTPRRTVSAAARLRQLLAEKRLIVTPCCYDGLTARLIESAGFELTFMTGFGVSAVRGYPDCQLVSYQEMLDSAFGICSSLQSICCIADGDTGYGNAVNVKRTVHGYAQAGMAGVMIEDQVAPKRCGHTRGKSVVSRAEAVARIKAACDARDEGKFDICIMGRTDARLTDGLDEAIERCKAYVEAGADITFLEAPLGVEEMERYCREVPGPKMVNMLPSGQTPMLPIPRLEAMGFNIAAYPLTLLSAGLKAQRDALKLVATQGSAAKLELSFEELKRIVGFEDYYAEEQRYATT
mmetsp:Transcript_20227/g.47208  ORF Transcript_20227/g.47208 Transcript_20227/m.47208 type:complete len:355 (-) Transcript_20227:153-1217(-)